MESRSVSRTRRVPGFPIEEPLMIKLRRVLLMLAAAAGIIASSTLPAAAGTVMQNHCEPDSN